jgi:predicted TIM-barrel fold metal-dependent hydrolase
MLDAGTGWIDLALGLPGERAAERAQRVSPLLRSAEERAALERPQGRLPADAGADPIAWAVREMDRFGAERGMLELGPLALRAAQRHPQRFFLSYEADANAGMQELARIRALHAAHGIRAVTARPSELSPQVPIDDRRWYPIYALCVELDVPFVCSVGVPRARVPFSPQKVERVDEVCWFFPELRFVMRDRGEPWTDLAVLLLAKWPNLFLMTSGCAPADYPAAWLELADARPDKLLFAGGFPDVPLELCAKQLRELRLGRHVWQPFLRDNARRVFRLPG